MPESGQTAKYKQNVSTRREDRPLSFASPIDSIHKHLHTHTLTHTHSHTLRHNHTHSQTDTIRPVSTARSDTSMQMTVRNAPLLDRQDHFCVMLVFFGEHIKAVLRFRGGHDRDYNRWSPQEQDSIHCAQTFIRGGGSRKPSGSMAFVSSVRRFTLKSTVGVSQVFYCGFCPRVLVACAGSNALVCTSAGITRHKMAVRIIQCSVQKEPCFVFRGDFSNGCAAPLWFIGVFLIFMLRSSSCRR